MRGKATHLATMLTAITPDARFHHVIPSVASSR